MLYMLTTVIWNVNDIECNMGYINDLLLLQIKSEKTTLVVVAVIFSLGQKLHINVL
jgi:hypothetical protein